jgi:hypothetical protein
MTSTPLRDVATRKKDVLETLAKNGRFWLGTADPTGKPHVIAVSAWWESEEFVVATLGSSRTARNIEMNPRVTMATGAFNDAIVIHAQMIESRAVEDSPDLAKGFKAVMGWEPGEVGPGWIFLRLRPTKIQAFRDYEEIEGRDVMLRSRWLA